MIFKNVRIKTNFCGEENNLTTYSRVNHEIHRISITVYHIFSGWGVPPYASQPVPLGSVAHLILGKVSRQNTTIESKITDTDHIAKKRAGIELSGYSNNSHILLWVWFVGKTGFSSVIYPSSISNRWRCSLPSSKNLTSSEKTYNGTPLGRTSLPLDW